MKPAQEKKIKSHLEKAQKQLDKIHEVMNPSPKKNGKLASAKKKRAVKKSRTK